MLLTSTPALPSDARWALEIKWDGMRAQLRFDGERVSVRSRHRRECSDQFPELAAIAGALEPDTILDGELVCLDADGRPDFERLRTRLRAGTAATISRARVAAPAKLIIFDVLHLAGEGACRLSYGE